jgi:hypothetical protein
VLGLVHAAPGMSRLPAVADVYLTNGIFLYRIIGLVADVQDVMVELEDCYFLDVVHVSLRHLRHGRLRAVTPASVDGGGLTAVQVAGAGASMTAAS